MKAFLRNLVLVVLLLACPSGTCSQADVSAAKPAGSASVACWGDENKAPWAVLLCVHGLGLHKGTFADFGKRLAAEGVVTYALDLPGFGSRQAETERKEINFPSCVDEVRSALVSIRRSYPGLPLFLLGESMGGAIALRTTALNPDLVAGLISSCPSGERYRNESLKAKVALHALTGGFRTPVAIGPSLVDQATRRSDVRSAWLNDPGARLSLSPHELLAFQRFMDQNFTYAGQIVKTPVLLIQGCQDKLVRPAGTWDLFDYLKTPNRDRVFSTHAEHLIFEEGQFNNDDVHYVLSWLRRWVPVQAGRPASETATAAGAAVSPGSATAARSASGPAAQEDTVSAAMKPPAAGSTEASKPVAPEPLSMDYWIELYRGGKTYRCNNKTDFRSGDAIRFHFVPHTSGYAYILLIAGTNGDRAVLFPTKEAGLDNFLTAGQDCVLPTAGRLQFDNKPGTERVSLVFSRSPLNAMAYLEKHSNNIAFVSSDRTGAKDLVPTRMELSWDDPAPVILPGQIQQALSGGSVVQVKQRDRLAVLAIDIALEHR